MKLFAQISVVALISFSAFGCSTLDKSDDPSRQTSRDPIEGLNRAVYSFNSGADKIVLRPIAKAYSATLPKPAKKSVGRFFRNLNEPLNALNNLLQGNVDGALSSTFRFAVNSTVGVFGLFDVANKLDVKPAQEDFGQTLAAWGVGPGPYLMLPFLGPSNLRDLSGTIVDSSAWYPINRLSDSNSGRFAFTALNTINTRAELIGADLLLNKQLDPYSFIKQASEQNRLKKIYNGDPPEIEEDF
jgi:phospholipid-binding lipoprotein MlaA